MGTQCVVLGCKNNRARTSKSFFRFPKIKKVISEKLKEQVSRRLRLWIKSVNRPELDYSSERRICQDHFHSGKPAKMTDETHPDWVPSLNMGLIKPSDVARYERLQRRHMKLDTETTEIDPCTNEKESEDVMTTNEPETLSISENTESIVHDYNSLKTRSLELEEECRQLRRDVNVYKARCARREVKLREFHKKITALEEEKQFVRKWSRDHKNTRLYTGIHTSELLACVNEYVSSFMTWSNLSQLRKEEQIFLTLMKLRTDESFHSLADRFMIPCSTASRLFHKTLEIMYRCLGKPNIIWGDRETLRLSMPMSFRNYFPDCVAIIDCFEIFCDRPIDLQERCATYSNYKHHNTVKYLIAITPQGTVSFISKGFGGYISDKSIVMESGFLNCVKEGDVILADRGFLIEDAVNLKGAILKRPAFKGRNREQISPRELEETRQIATLRIHVERVIGNIKKKFRMLRGPVQHGLLKPDDEKITTIDKVVTVCCALTNLNPSIVPSD